MAFWGSENKKNKDEPTPTVSFTKGFSSSSSSEQTITSKTNPMSLNSNTEDFKIRSALGPGTVIQGKLSFDAPVSIDGKLSGEIYSSKTLVVGKSGTVDAQVDVAVLIVKGIVKGHIKASERIEIREKGQLIGDVITPSLVIEEGCIFNGGCQMSSVNSIRKSA